MNLDTWKVFISILVNLRRPRDSKMLRVDWGKLKNNKDILLTKICTNEMHKLLL